MAYCGECKKECEVKVYGDSDGDGIYTRHFTVIESVCCGAEVFKDEDCTKPVELDDVDDGGWDD